MAELLLRGVVVTSCFFWLLSIMPQLTVPYVLDVCVQLTSGLRHLHDHGIVHRDLKADNALVASTAPLAVKWADFGCSEKLVKPFQARTAQVVCRKHHTMNQLTVTITMPLITMMLQMTYPGVRLCGSVVVP